MEPVRLGIVGAGGIAQAYAQALKGVDCARLVAVADVRVDAARAMAEGLGGQAFESHTAMLQRSRAGRGGRLHAAVEPSRRSAATSSTAGVHVLCEKPLAVDSASGRAHARGRRRPPGSSSRWRRSSATSEDVIRAKSIVTSGILGEIIALRERVHLARRHVARAGTPIPAISGGGVLIDNGTHSVDLMRYFLGPLADVQVVEGKRIQGLRGRGHRPDLRAQPGGGPGQHRPLVEHRQGARHLPQHLRLAGHGVAWAGRSRGTASRRAGTGSCSARATTRCRRSAASCGTSAGAVRGTEAPLITPEDALASVEVVEAAYEALREAHWLEVNGKTAALKSA